MSLHNLIDSKECPNCVNNKNYQLSDKDFKELSLYNDDKLSQAIINISKHKNGQSFGNIICKVIKLRFNLQDGEISDAKGIEIKNTTLSKPAYKQVRLDRDIPQYIFSWVYDNKWKIFLLSKEEINDEIIIENIKKGNTHPEATHYTLTFPKKRLKNLVKYQLSLLQLKEKLLSK